MDITSTTQAALGTSDSANPTKTPPPQNTGGKAAAKSVSRSKGGRKIDTLEKFRAWTPPEDGFKYEWNKGVIEKSPIDVFICKGDRVCSAEPVLPGFALSAEALFANA